ncbi:MAG: hypothetical protein Q8R60_08995 [Mycobacteriales bacterium]|nr:hypothetical protein [Mycobacteriales bacterium]
MRALLFGGLVAGALLLAGCGGGATTPQADPGVPCTSLPPADPAAVLPTGFPALADQVLYAPASQGATRIVFGRVPGTDFLALRDDLVARLTAAGFRIESTDQEAVEAEAFFTGPVEGTVKVQRLCAEQLEVRYKLDG